MKTDTVLSKNEKILIIDTKFYKNIYASYFETETIKSNNLYQIFTYVKNMAEVSTDEVSGMLLYAGTLESLQPEKHNNYSMSGNKIGVRSLDLYCHHIEIANQLDSIVNEWLYWADFQQEI